MAGQIYNVNDIFTQQLDFAASGDNTAIAAVANTKFNVVKALIFLASETTVIFKSGSNVLSGGAATMKALALPIDEMPWFVSENANEAFIITLGAAVQCSGILWYTKDTTP